MPNRSVFKFHNEQYASATVVTFVPGGWAICHRMYIYSGESAVDIATAFVPDEAHRAKPEDFRGPDEELDPEENATV